MDCELECIAIEDAILQGIRRWLSRDGVENTFHSMWLEDFEMDYSYGELEEDIEAFANSLWGKMDAGAWIMRGRYHTGTWRGAVLRLLCERE